MILLADGALNWHSILFLLTGGFASAFALGVLFTSNVVRMAFFLIISLAATSGLFMLAGAMFLGAMQIMIYVGGTLVLLIFGVMLTARASYVSMRTSSGEWVIAFIVGGALLLVLLQAATSVPDWMTPRENQAELAAVETESATSIGQALINVRVDSLHEEDPTGGRRAGLSGYLLPFEIISIHLLIVLVGAAFLARAKRRVGPESVSP